MKKPSDFKIADNRIVRKKYDGTKCSGEDHFMWVTLVEVNRSECIGSLGMFMSSLLTSVYESSI